MPSASRCAFVSSLLLLAAGQEPQPCPDGHCNCPGYLQAVYADMHDGDQKEVTISGKSLTIKPSGNDQTWIVKTELDLRSCSANIDFNVPGKPDPPPVNLTATLWFVLSSKDNKTEFEFTDPSGTLAAKDFPLNRWVELKKPTVGNSVTCQKHREAVYADMMTGDKKLVIVDGEDMIIKPYHNDQNWIVETKVNLNTCSAFAEFNVPGKPGKLHRYMATFLYTKSLEGKDMKSEYEFTDPSETLASSDFPLNHWVEISGDPHFDDLMMTYV